MKTEEKWYRWKRKHHKEEKRRLPSLYYNCTNYRKSSNTSRPLIQVASIRGRTIGGPVQPLIVGKILNPSKLPYLDHFELFEVKNLALEFIFIFKTFGASFRPRP